MTASSRPTGRPLKFESVEDLEIRINQYFDDCDNEYDNRKWTHGDIIVDDDGKTHLCSECYGKARSRGCILVSGEKKSKRPYTITGLAVWLDTSRQTLLEYQGEVPGREKDPAFADTIGRAKQRIENYAHEKLYDGDYPTRGVIFSLSNNFDNWSERKTTDVNIGNDGAKLLGERLFDAAAKEAQTPSDALDSSSEQAAAGEAE